MCNKNTEVRVMMGLADCDPHKSPVLIIGQQKHLLQVKYSDIACKFESRVTEEVWNSGVQSLQPSPTDTVSLYLNLCSVSALPYKVSRHNTESRAHSISKIVRSHTVAAEKEYIVLVCERSEMYASVCAVSRAFPLFTRKSNLVNSRSRKRVIIEMIFPDDDTDPLHVGDVDDLNSAIYGIRLAARIVDTPANEMDTNIFLDEILAVAGELKNVKVIVHKGEELREKGFGGIYGVGKAAKNPPILAALCYWPKGATKKIAWVGKGIVYDTGGLSLKTKTSMPGMKRDCGGAAAVLGAFYHAVKCGFSENLNAVFCLAENAVGPEATKPDDIHTLYSGRTVEINNTDAEGRLVLGDGVVFAAQDLGCEYVVDIATLTGAQATATGKYHAGILSNCSLLEDCCVRAGRSSGDLAHALPYSPEMHFTEFASAVADMKNSVADRNNATSSCAGLFIAAQLGFDFPGKWLHIDMAAPVCVGDRATGYGSSLLNVLFGEFTNSALLKSLAPHLPEAQKAVKKNNNQDDAAAQGDDSVTEPEKNGMTSEAQPNAKRVRLD